VTGDVHRFAADELLIVIQESIMTEKMASLTHGEVDVLILQASPRNHNRGDQLPKLTALR
jgi:hypothetical protein